MQDSQDSRKMLNSTSKCTTEGLVDDRRLASGAGVTMNSEHAIHGARSKLNVFALASVIALVGGCSTVAPATAGPRPAAWATPVAASPGLPNLNRVNASLYRSAQPTEEGFAYLDAGTSLANADRPIKT